MVSRKKSVKRGRGIVSSIINKAIDLIPLEAHIPGYNYCGPGTKLEKRLARGDKPINLLDQHCLNHDIAYAKYKDSDRRSQADKELAEKAWQRFKAKDSSLAEKGVAWAVTNIMKAKTKLGGGKKKKVKKVKKAQGLYLKPYPKRGGGKIKKKKTKCCKKKRQSR